MNEQAENEVLEQEEAHEQQEAGQREGETPEGEQAEGEQSAEQAQEDGEVVISFGEDAPTSEEVEHQAAPAWVRELRKADREKARQLRERDAELARLKAELEGRNKPAELMQKPKLSDEGIDFDEEIFEQKLTAWHEAQRAAKAEKEAKEAEEKKALEAWQANFSAYQTAGKTLKVDDFEAAEDVVKGALNQMQMAVILDATSTPEAAAKMVVALAHNKAQLDKLASTKHPIKFAVAVGKLEDKMTVQPRKAAPAPERTLKGGSTAVGVTDNKLAQLEAEAERTGDRTKVLAYRREQRARQAGN